MRCAHTGSAERRHGGTLRHFEAYSWVVSGHAVRSVKRWVTSSLAGLLLSSAGITVYFLSENAPQGCFAPFGSGTGVVPSARRSGVDCTVANWSYSLAIAAVICGADVALFGLIAIARDRVSPIDDRAS